MEFFKHNTKINFMAQRKWAALFSLILFGFSIFALLHFGLNWGLDFTGGTQLHLTFPETANVTEVRASLEQAGFKDAVVISYGTTHEVLVTLMPQQEVQALTGEQNQEGLVASVLKVLPTASVKEVNFIGPQVGQELATKGALAVVIALLGTMIYIALRFETRFALGSTLALIHDPLIILGVFAYFHLEFNLIALAAVLTVIGYSLNDTIVIFDRVRENFRRIRKATPFEVMNQAINQTLSRTIMTSALTLTVVLALYFLGGSMVHGFALAMIIGILVGTYSSIYVAGSFALTLGLNRQHLLPTPKEILDDRP
ncbi:MAG TPA: protein translocase subunit SecF [Gammaproteobacteria bacterium]|nr:protein translocase subunit SecF [Gammaproteobacteria bacterium]